MILSLDVETTINQGKNKDGYDLTNLNGGGVHDPHQFMVCYSWYTNDGRSGCSDPLNNIHELEALIHEAELIVGFNFKFDYQWFKRYGVKLHDKRIWDCQTAEFILSRQEHRFPSLDECCAKYGLGQKLDVVKSEYWNKGYDTHGISWDILSRYAIEDTRLTLELYKKQKEVIGSKERIISLCCQDLVGLAEMEYNGMRFQREESLRKAKEIEAQLVELDRTISKFHSVPNFNPNSNDHLSALLYGGVILDDVRVPNGTYKTGKKIGETRYKIEVKEYTLPRLLKPLRGTEMDKGGVYSTAEDTLLKLAKHPVLETILESRKLEKLRGTYYEGLPARQDEMNCNKDFIYGQFNQCVAQTGRLSSSKPNLQNIPDDLQKLFISRYEG
jgi:DNA polymerase I-like protein with 3'-5' exonuclease and polymerase domains